LKQKAAFFWSGGKDSSLALHYIQKEDKFNIEYLITTVSAEFDRVSMHGIISSLAEKQAHSIGIPLKKMINKGASNSSYEEAIENVFKQCKIDGITHVIFGDINLEDLRKYREELLNKFNLIGVYPLWGKPTIQLINEFIFFGFKSVLCCVNDQYLSKQHLGQTIDLDWIEKLPSNVDPCGENGEFHTFCFDGPIYKTPVRFKPGDTIHKPFAFKNADSSIENAGFWFLDLK